MLALEEIWIVAGVAGAALLTFCTFFLFRKGRKDYDLVRNEGTSHSFDFAAQQRELHAETMRIEAARKRAESQARAMADEASQALSQAAMEEGNDLKELAQNAALPMFDSPTTTTERTITAAHEAEAQALIRRQQAQINAAIARQEEEISRVKAQQERAIENARASHERAKEAHFSLLSSTEPRPAIISYAAQSPLQKLANTMQASYAQVAWAFAALARKLE